MSNIIFAQIFHFFYLFFFYFPLLLFQIEIDECLSFPCRHRGECTDLVNDYECDCQEGWGGKQCDEPIQYCNGSQCDNGAQCLSLFTGHFCQCVYPFYGDRCEMQVGHVTRVLCCCYLNTSVSVSTHSMEIAVRCRWVGHVKQVFCCYSMETSSVNCCKMQVGVSCDLVCHSSLDTSVSVSTHSMAIAARCRWVM